MSARNTSYAGVGTASLSSDDTDTDGPYHIHGVALGVDDVTIGQSRTKKYWPAETLRQAAETLEGQPLVRDHINSTKGRIGTVTQATFAPGVGVLYEAEIKSHYEQLARDIQSGMMEVSPRIKHLPKAELETRDSDGALRVDPPAVFDNLSVVNNGASPSNTAEPGQSPHFPDSDTAAMAAVAMIDDDTSTATLTRTTVVDASIAAPDTLSTAELEDQLDEVYDEWQSHVNMTASELRQWASNPCAQQASTDPKAVISRNLNLLETDKSDWGSDEIADAKRTISFISRMKDEANEPDEPKDGPHGCPSEWAISLLNWAFNPFSDVPSPPSEGDLADADGYDESELSVSYEDTPSGQSETTQRIPGHSDELYETQAEAAERAEEIGCSGSHEHEVDGETMYMPCSSMSIFEETIADAEQLAGAAFDAGDWVEWNVQNGTDIGVVESVHHEGDELPDFRGDPNFSPSEGEHLYAIQLYRSVDGTFHPIEDGLVGHYQESLTPVDKPDDVSDESMALDELTDTSDTAGVAELADYEMHEPDWDGTTEGEWSRPDYSEFQSAFDFESDTFVGLSEDEKQSVAAHFLIAQGGFPGDEYSDLGLPVVEPSGDLSLSALRTVKGGHGAGAVDGLSDEMESKIDAWVNETANEVFDKQWGEPSETAEQSQSAQMSTADDSTDTDESSLCTAELAMVNGMDVNGLVMWSNDDGQQIGTISGIESTDGTTMLVIDVLGRDDGVFTKTGETVRKPLSDVSEADEDEMTSSGAVADETDTRHSVTVASIGPNTHNSHTTHDTMTEIDYESADAAELSADLDDPVVLERSDLESLVDDADRSAELESKLETLDQSVEELSDAQDLVAELSDEEETLLASDTETTVVDEELAETVDEVTQLLAEELASASDLDAELLAERFDPVELRNQIESHDSAQLSAEIGSMEPEPEAGDPDDAELEQTTDDAELSDDEIEAYAAELERAGWETQAEKVRNGDIDIAEAGD